MPRPAVVVAVALPLLLAVTVAAIAIVARARGLDASTVTSGPDTRPLVVAAVDAPDAASNRCTTLLAGLDGDLPADTTALPRRALADPIPPGVRAWAADPQPVVLRCGLPRPRELTPTSALLEIDGVSWLTLDDGGTGVRLISYVAVDRPVYVALTEPSDLGSGPLQAVSDVVRTTLPATPVAVR